MREFVSFEESLKKILDYINSTVWFTAEYQLRQDNTRPSLYRATPACLVDVSIARSN